MAVGDLSGMTAEREIDASGLTVAPGFIDTHAHSDGVLLRDPVHAHGLVQGVTTEFITQDGLSYALLSEENLDSYGRYIAGTVRSAADGSGHVDDGGVPIALRGQGLQRRSSGPAWSSEA